MNILIAITAKNEEFTIRDTIVSIKLAIVMAERALDISYELIVILNDSTDNTINCIPSEISIIKTTGGIVEAQRTVVNRSPFVIFSDADILVSSGSLIGVTKAMLEDPELSVAYPDKIPLRPVKSTWIANALYTYNKNHGFENRRQHFNGKFFAIRDWDIPEKETFRDKEYSIWMLQDGVIADDIYLSKSILAEKGIEAIKQTSGEIYYQAPASFKGMYRYFRRMKIELNRVSLLFPDLSWPSGAQRKTEFTNLKKASFREQLDWVIFQLSLQFCKLWFWWEKKRASYSNKGLNDIWQPVEETKTPFQVDLIRVQLENCHPIEIWDLIIDGKILWEWQEHDNYVQKLKKGIDMINTGTARTRSKGLVKNIAKGFDNIFITGGRSQDSDLRCFFDNAHFSDSSIFGACEAALSKWPDALVIDVGQTQIKIAYKDQRQTFSRDYDLLPIGEISDQGALLKYIKQSLPDMILEKVVLALPCYIHDDLTLGGSSYAEMKQNPNLLHEIALSYPTAKWHILNDAELATLCVDSPSKKTLVLTLGFGTGACIIDPT